MWKQGPAPGGLPPQRLAEVPGVHGQDDQIAHAAEVAAARFRRLGGGGEMDEAVGQVEGRAQVDAGREGVLPGLAGEDLVDQGQAAGPDAGPANTQRGVPPRWPGGS